jgi:ubiquitin-like 1-activating enzyme E1 B
MEFFELLSKTTKKDIKQLNILQVGAGGIGCELLKNLVILGVKSIHVVR